MTEQRKLADMVNEITKASITNTEIVAEGGICAPRDARLKITFEPFKDAKAEKRPSVCDCVHRVTYQAACIGKFPIPLIDMETVPVDVLSKLDEIECTKCGQKYLVAEWDDLATGLRFK